MYFHPYAGYTCCVCIFMCCILKYYPRYPCWVCIFICCTIICYILYEAWILCHDYICGMCIWCWSYISFWYFFCWGCSVLFVLADGWTLVVRSPISTVHTILEPPLNSTVQSATYYNITWLSSTSDLDPLYLVHFTFMHLIALYTHISYWELLSLTSPFFIFDTIFHGSGLMFDCSGGSGRWPGKRDFLMLFLLGFSTLFDIVS